jgi:photosystem II stability/assembly factor-like uncharacterized protein
MKNSYLNFSKYLILVIVLLSQGNIYSQWQKYQKMYSADVREILQTNSYIYAVSYDGGVFRTSGLNSLWQKVSTGLPFNGNYYNLLSIAQMNNNIYVAGYGVGVYKSSNNGDNWAPLNTGLPSLFVTKIVSSGSKLFGIVYGYGLYKLNIGDTAWTKVNMTGVTGNYTLNTISAFGNDVYVVFNAYRQVYRSTDNGDSWAYFSTIAKETYHIAKIDTFLYAGTNEGVYSTSINTGGWSFRGGTNVKGITIFDNKIYFATTNGIYYFTNTTTSQPVLAVSDIPSLNINTLTVVDNKLVAGASEGIFVNSVSTFWGPISFLSRTPTNVIGLAYDFANNYIIAGTTNGVLYNNSDDLDSYWRVNDYGLNFYNTLSANINIRSFKMIGDTLFAGNLGDFIYKKHINSYVWSKMQFGNSFPNDYLKVNKDLYVATTSGVYKSNNSSSPFTGFNNGINPINVQVNTLFYHGGRIYAGTSNGVFVRDLNDTLGWIAKGPQNYYVLAFDTLGTNILAAFHNGIYISTNNGDNWNKLGTGLPSTSYNAIVRYKNNIFVASNNQGVFVSTNNGADWSNFNNSFGAQVSSLAIFNGYLYAGYGLGQGVHRYKLETVTSNESHISQTLRYELKQNYPNPFNPVTTITFSLPVKSFVTLKVYDIIGKEVATIVNEELQAGTYEKKWDASNLNSGVYIYKLQSGNFSSSKKLILMK